MTPKRRKLTRKRTLNEQYQIHHRKSYHSFKIKRRWKRACYAVKLNNNGGLTGGISRKSQLQLNLINKAYGTADCDIENEATELQMTQLQMTQILQSTPVTIICMDCLLHKFCEIINRQNNLCEPFHQVLIKKCIEKAIGNNITTTEKCLECRLRRQSNLQTSVQPSVENVKATNIMLSVSGRSFEDRCATPTAHRRTSPAQFAIYHQEHLQLIYIDLHPKGSTTLAVPCISPEIFLLKMIICSKAECLIYIRLLWDMYSSIKDMIGHPEVNPSLNLSQDYLYTNHSEGSYSIVPTEEEPDIPFDNPIVPTEEDLGVLPEKLTVVPTKEEPGVLPEKPTVVPTKEEPGVLPEKPTVVPTKEEPGVLPEKPTVVPTKEEPGVLPEKLTVVRPTKEEPGVLPKKPTVVPTKEEPGVLPEKPTVVPTKEEPGVLPEKPTVVPTNEDLEVTSDQSIVPTEEELDVLLEKLTVVPTKEEPGVLPEKPTVVPTKEDLEVTSDQSIVPTEEELDVLLEKLTVVHTKEEPGVLPEKPSVVPTKEEPDIPFDNPIVPTEEKPDVIPQKPTVVPTKEEPGVLPEKPTVVPTKEDLEVTSDQSIVPTEEDLDVLPEKLTVVPTKEEPGVLPEKPTVVPMKEEPDIPFDNPIVPTEQEPDVTPQKPNVAPTKEKLTEVQAKAEPEDLFKKFTMFPTKVEHQVLPENLATVLMELERESLPEKTSLISTKKKSAFLRKKPILLKAGIEPTVDYQHPALVLKETVVVFLSKIPAVILKETVVTISTKTSTPVLQEMVIVVLPQTPVVVLTKIIAAVCIGSSGVDISLSLGFHGIKYMNNGQRTSASFNPCKMYGYNNRKGQSDFMFDMRLQNHTDIVVLPAGKSPEFPQSLVPIEANTCDDQAPITSDQDQAKVQSNQLDTTLQTPVITPPSMNIQEHTQNQTSLPVPSMMRNTSNIQRQRLLEMYTTHILADTRHEDNDNTLKEGDCSTKHDDGDGAAKDQELLLKHGSFSDQELSDEEGRTTGNDKPSQSNIQSAEDMHLISKLNEDSLSQNPTYKVSKLLKSSTKLKLMEGYDSQGKLPDCLHDEKGTQSQTNLTSIQSQGSEKTMPSDHSQVPSNLTFDVGHISDNTMTPSDSQSHSEVTSGFSKSSYNNVTTDDSSSNNTATPPDCQSPPDLPFDVGQYSDNMVTPADEMDSDNIVMTSYSQSHSNLSNDIDQNFEYRVTPSDSQSNLSNDIDQNFEYRVTPSDLQSQSNLTKDTGQGSECKVTPSNSQSWSNLNNDADQGSEYKVTASQGLSNPPNDVGQSSENRVTLDDPQSHFHHTNCSYNIEMPESSGSDMVTLKYSGADMMMPDYFSSDNTVTSFDFQSPPDLTKDACHGSNMVTPDDSSLNNMSMPVDSGSDNMMTSHDFASYKKGTPDDSGSDNTVTYDDSQSPPNLTVRPQRHDALQTKETSKRQQPEQWPSLENCSIINSIETEGIQFRSDDSDTDSETYLKEIWQEEIGDSVNLYLDDYKVRPFSCDPGTTEEFSCDPLSGNFALIEINQMTDNEENQETQPKRYCFSPIAHDHHHQRLEDNTTHNFSSNQCGNDRCQGMNEETHVDTSKYINTSSTSLDEQQDTRNQIVTRCSQVLPETRQHEVIRDRHVLPPSSRDVIAQPINNASDLAEEIPRAGSRITAEPNFLVLTHPNRADDFQYLGNVMEGQNLIHLRHPQTGASQQQDTRLDTRGSTNVTVTICHRQRQVSVLTFPTPIDIGHLIQAIEQDENVQDILGSYPGSRRLEWEEFLTRENVWIIDHNTTIELVLH